MKAISLISGGIDSPVATHLMLAKGLDVVLVHFDNRPFTDGKGTEKTKKLIKILAKKHKKKLKLYIVKHSDTQSELLKKCEHQKLCVLCRRMMYRIAEKIAKKEKAAALITGENLGQVASQTLDNLVAERSAIKLPVLQPILCLDKEEIISIAKKIKTYETSIEPGMCCTVVPKWPETHAELEIIEEMEKKLDVKKLVDKAVKNVEVINIK